MREGDERRGREERGERRGRKKRKENGEREEKEREGGTDPFITLSTTKFISKYIFV